MATKIELGSLLDLAIGKPEIGAVNFKTLHSFLQKLLSHLAVASVQVEVNNKRFLCVLLISFVTPDLANFPYFF